MKLVTRLENLAIEENRNLISDICFVGGLVGRRVGLDIVMKKEI